MASKLFVVLAVLFIFACILDSSESWSGHYQRIRRYLYRRRTYCICWYGSWGCSAWRYRWRWYYSYTYRCQPGWTHNGNGNCNIPLCRPTCANGGTCERPNRCSCPSTATGLGCRNPVCSYLKPCYPGTCYDSDKCECNEGFKQSGSDGCLSFDENAPEMYPSIGRATATIYNVERIHNTTTYMFVMDGTNTNETEEVWSNQRVFNVLEFNIESEFQELVDEPERTAYVFEAGFGIVRAHVEVNITSYPWDGGLVRDPGFYKVYDCPLLSSTSPEKGTSNCTIFDNQFKTAIEHGDWMEVKYQADSGGFRQLNNIDDQNKYYRTDNYTGLQDIKKVKFLFDFFAPEHCSNTTDVPCPADASILKVQEEITSNPIRPYWKGWTDDLAGVGEYYVEVFPLLPNKYDKLVEKKPTEPWFSIVVPHEDLIDYPEYTPNTTGIYSVLMETRDKSNNSRIARSFVIYDNTSEIILNSGDNGKLYVSSADPQSDYKWQTTKDADTGKSTFTVKWDNHFINSIHEDGMFLNPILPYPILFEDIDRTGVLFSKKFVADELDDHDGTLTRDGVTNFHGIVRFEVNTVFTLDEEEPQTPWRNISPLAEQYTFSSALADGHGVRIWVRATDIMGHTSTDSVYVQLDTSAPIVSSENSTDTKFDKNFDGVDAKYNYTTRISFVADDGDSEIHLLKYEIIVETFGKDKNIEVRGNQSATSTSIQKLDLDNCWFMVNKDDLAVSTATVNVDVYNTAMLSTSLRFKIDRINTLRGLERYSGPQNFRIETTKSESVRIAWDLPDQVSCYGQADIILLIATFEDGKNKTEVFYVSKGSTSYTFVAKPNTKYSVAPAMQLTGGNPVLTGENLAVQTPEPEETSGGITGGVVAGVAVGVIVLVAIVLVVFILLIRRGHFQPVRRGVERVGTKFRNTISHRPPTREKNQYAYDNRTSELYIYGGMDFDENKSWHIPRSDITFETLLKSGHFANIYKAVYNRNRKTHETVVAKTLKENSSENDQMLMKAKINFTATRVGNHANVVKFIGAVVDDAAMGPFIIYEYCEHGPLKDHLQSQRSNVTLEVQESLFRFGLDIAKGMEFLASKGIVHRRLAARNILLTFLNEIKIAGFGPQPESGGEEDGDAEKGKKERIPIKWMGPECMSSTADATEKSDVWSYAVVLWEIFSLGSTPYENIRSRDLPGRVKKGEHLQQPEYCDDTWYGVMRQCWALNQDKRPTFSEIRNQLDGLFVSAPGDDYYYYKR